jgi:hypothetical protein
MEAHQLINAWLNSRQDYDQGLALAKAHGVGGPQLALLQSGRNKYTQGKLRTALKELHEQLVAEAGQPVARAAQVLDVASPAPVPAAAAAPAEAPPELVELRKRRAQTFKQANHHFGQMRVATPGPERKEHAKAVKRLFRENAALWNAEAYYLEYGYLPQATVATFDRTDLRAVEKRRNTLRTYLSSAKGGGRAIRKPEQVATWKAELLELDLILNHG